MRLQLGDGICIHPLLRRKGWANAAPELRVVTLREMCHLWREYFYEYDFACRCRVWHQPCCSIWRRFSR